MRQLCNKRTANYLAALVLTHNEFIWTHAPTSGFSCRLENLGGGSLRKVFKEKEKKQRTPGHVRKHGAREVTTSNTHTSNPYECYMYDACDSHTSPCFRKKKDKKAPTAKEKNKKTKKNAAKKKVTFERYIQFACNTHVTHIQS